MNEPVSPPPTTAPRRRGPPRRVTVARVAVLSPRMRRVTFSGPALEGFALTSPAAYIKLVFPPAGEHVAPAWAPDGPRPASTRTYTPLQFRPDVLEVDVDFVLHGEGPASTWATAAAVGDQLFLNGPGPGYKLELDAPHYVLIGDDSALPAVETILEALPPNAAVTIFVEAVAADEKRAITARTNVAVHWLYRGEDKHAAGTALEPALRSARFPPDSRVYIACESTAMRRLRKLITDEHRIPASHIVGRGYWKLGAVNHPDHDYGEDG